MSRILRLWSRLTIGAAILVGGVTFAAGPPDDTPPSAPGNLVATAVSGSQINLSWTPATDQHQIIRYYISRCTGASCTNYASVTNLNALSYSDTGLTSGLIYRYVVWAQDSWVNNGPGAFAQATTFDGVAPSAPSGLGASAASGTQINLSWSAASDNVGVTGYAIERCQGAGCSSFSQIATSASTSYSSTSLTPATSYSFRVRGYDAASNYGGYSNTASAATTDTVAPSATSGLSASAASGTQI
ncbi:MAG: fibronectin type III domain-containing protein, partial [Steroidobacteraceae bacterium]